MTTTPRSAAPPQLIDVAELALMLRRSVPSLRRDDAAGRLPAPVRIGGSKRWRADEIASWVAAGCPNRTDWTFNTKGE